MRAIRLVPIVLVLCLVWVLRPPGAAAEATPVQQLLSLVNDERAAAGVPPLALRGDLTDIAGSWSVSMADTGRLAHNDAYFSADVRRQIGPGARAENVAYAGDIVSIHRVLMASPPHRANLLDARYTVVGVGAVFDGSLWWVTQDFLAAPLPAPPAEPLVTTTTVAVVRALPEAEAPPAAVVLAAAPPAPVVVDSAPPAQAPLSIDLDLQGAPDVLEPSVAPPAAAVRSSAPPVVPSDPGLPGAALFAVVALLAAASATVVVSRATDGGAGLLRRR